MFKKTIVVLAATAILSVSTIAAQAATTFSFTSTRSDVTSFDMSVGGIDLTVRAGQFTNAGAVSISGKVLTHNTDGLGVKRNNNDAGNVDGSNGNDLAIFDFGQKVKFESIVFSRWEGNDEYSFFAGDPLTKVSYNFEKNQDLSASDYIGMLFGVGAKDGNDEFRIKSISVTAVPLPSSVLLFGGALLGMGWLSRRKLKSVTAA